MDYQIPDLPPILKQLAASPFLDVAVSAPIAPFSLKAPRPVGQSAPPDIQRAFFGADGADTFAVVDAATCPHLPEGFGALDHVCLFRGKAAEDYGQVAPYVCRLSPDAPFVSQAFTRSDMQSDLWDRGAVLFVQAADHRDAFSLDQVAAHFRRFTRLQKPDGAWMYHRLSETRALAYYLNALSADPSRLVPFVMARGCRADGGDLALRLSWVLHDRLVQVTPSAALSSVPRGPVRLGDEEQQGFRQYRWDSFCSRVLAALDSDYEDAAHIVKPGLSDVTAWCAQGRHLGITSEASLYRYAAAALCARAADQSLLALRDRIADWPVLSQRDQSEKLLQLALQSLSNRFSSPFTEAAP